MSTSSQTQGPTQAQTQSQGQGQDGGVAYQSQSQGSGPLPDNRSITRSVEHTTRYSYVTSVGASYHLAVLKPRDNAQCLALNPCQRLEHFELQITPQPASCRVRNDSYQNLVHEFEITQSHNELTVTANAVLSLQPAQIPAEQVDAALAQTPPWERIRNSLSYRKGSSFMQATEFAFPSPRVPFRESLKAYALLEFWPQRPIGQACQALMQRIHREFKYASGSTGVNTSVDEVMQSREGVCQDFSHIMIGALRSIGLAVRYVSGYMMTEPPPGQAKLIGADASHAWVSIWAGEPLGWIDMDPTNNQLPDTRYITVAVGRDYADVPPLKGVIHGGGEHELHVGVTVR